MKNVQKASLLVISLSILALGLSCGRAMARFAGPEQRSGVPAMGNFKTISVPQFQMVPIQNTLAAPGIFPSRDQPGSSISKISAERIQSSGGSHSPRTIPSRNPPPNLIEKVSGPRMAVINVSNARFRQEPSITAAKIACLQKGEVGEIIEQKAGWTRLVLPAKGMIGWIRDDLLVLQTTP